MSALLELSDVTAHYGPSQALFGVSLSIHAGEVVALMGRNGMGKTTTVHGICRMVSAHGTMRFGGHDLTRLSSHKVAQLGVGLVPEGRRCFAGLTVEENLIATARPGHWTLATVYALFPRLKERRGQVAASLSGGEQQMLSIGRALMTNPRLLILDEATEGLAPLIRQEIWTVIKQLKSETGMAILLIDKALREMRGICDSAVILARGKTVFSGPMAEVNEDIAARYLGL